MTRSGPSTISHFGDHAKQPVSLHGEKWEWRRILPAYEEIERRFRKIYTTRYLAGVRQVDRRILREICSIRLE